MTFSLVPFEPEEDDREPEPQSLISRMDEWWENLSQQQAWFILGVILAALTIAVGIVTW